MFEFLSPGNPCRYSKNVKRSSSISSLIFVQTGHDAATGRHKLLKTPYDVLILQKKMSSLTKTNRCLYYFLLSLFTFCISCHEAADFNLTWCSNGTESCIMWDTIGPIVVWGGNHDDHSLDIVPHLRNSQVVRYGVKLPLRFFQEKCPTCELFWVVPLHTNPDEIASAIIQMYDSGGGSRHEINSQYLVMMVGEAQLSLYFYLTLALERHLVARGDDVSKIEGNCKDFLVKIRLMRQFALQLGKETVCEVGFNAGHSALLWLTAGARRVISFDIGSHAYSSHAISWLTARFPGRLQVTLGDSRDSVPTFSALWPDFRCNIVYIDGGHSEDAAAADIRNFHKLHNSSNHVLLMDDIDGAEVARAWAAAIDSGLARQIGSVSGKRDDFVSRPFTANFDWTGELHSGTPHSVVQWWMSELAHGEYI